MAADVCPARVRPLPALSLFTRRGRRTADQRQAIAAAASCSCSCSLAPSIAIICCNCLPACVCLRVCCSIIQKTKAGQRRRVFRVLLRMQRLLLLRRRDLVNCWRELLPIPSVLTASRSHSSRFVKGKSDSLTDDPFCWTELCLRLVYVCKSRSLLLCFC